MSVSTPARGARLSDIEAVYRSRSGAFMRLARAIVGTDEEAWDAVHDAMVSAIRSRASFRGDGSLEAWLWQAVMNAARSRARRSTAGEPTPEPDANPHDAEDDREVVRRAVARLPERQRLVLFLRYYAGFRYEEIGAVLGLQSGTVGPTLTAAQATLRELLGGLDL
jgi:RNA polymerase sigma-70 factor (ECF subfamily)